MLCDTGPLVAIIDRSDNNHARCLQVLATLLTPLLTTWPCFTEAMYLLARYGGQPALCLSPQNRVRPLPQMPSGTLNPVLTKRKYNFRCTGVGNKKNADTVFLINDLAKLTAYPPVKQKE